MEQGTGVEPASEAWEATIIADILTLRDGKNYSIADGKMQAEMFDRKPGDPKVPGFEISLRFCGSVHPGR